MVLQSLPLLPFDSSFKVNTLYGDNGKKTAQVQISRLCAGLSNRSTEGDAVSILGDLQLYRSCGVLEQSDSL